MQSVAGYVKRERQQL